MAPIANLVRAYLPLFAALFIVVAGAIGFALYSRECTDARGYPHSQGSQGYRIWENEIFKSFEHRDRKICIPDGWVPIGAATTTTHWATFDTGRTGVLIRANAFLTTHIEDIAGAYTLSLLYPATTSPEDVVRYTELARHAFTTVGSLYPHAATAKTPHTVLITYGLIQRGLVYPDPTKDRTVMMRHSKDPRGEELLTHAVAHLYNRYGTHERSYLEHQAPFTAEEFQELEATWAEIALAHKDSTRLARVEYLYRVHHALMTKAYQTVAEPPFNDTAAFERVVPTVMVPDNASYLDFQYGHYVLAPLVMVAIDGLLATHGAPVSVKQILVDLHEKGEQNFLDRVSSYVSKDDMVAIDSWVRGLATIPRALIDSGVAGY